MKTNALHPAIAFSALTLLGFGNIAKAQVFFSSDTTINYAITDHAIVGYADQMDYDQQINGTSPTISVVNGASISSISSLNSSTINLINGSIGSLGSGNSSTLNIIDGDCDEVNAYNSSAVNIKGGNIRLYLSASNNSVINVSGGKFGGYLATSDSSIANVSGGDIQETYSNGSSTVNIGGGHFSTLHISDSSTVNLFGTNLSATLTNPNYGGYSVYTLYGNLADGTSINCNTLQVSNTSQAKFNLINQANPYPQRINNVKLSAYKKPLPSIKPIIGIGAGYRIDEFYLNWDYFQNCNPNILCEYMSESNGGPNGPNFYVTTWLKDFLLGYVSNDVILSVFKPGTLPVELRNRFAPLGSFYPFSLPIINKCILNGDYNPNSYYLVWHSPNGFKINPFGTSLTIPHVTEPLALAVDLDNGIDVSNFGIPSPDNIDPIVREAEEYIHKTLLDYLPFIAPLFWPTVTIIVDPGQVTLKVTNSAGQSTGILPNGTQVADIPGSFYIPSPTNPAVIILDADDDTYQTAVTGVTAGNYSVSALTSNPAFLTTTEKMISGQITQGQTASFRADVFGSDVTFANGPTSTVYGTITLEGCANPTQRVTFEFRPTNGGVSFSAATNLYSDGSFFFADVPKGNYTLHIKGEKWLAKNIPVNTTNNSVYDLTATLEAGDADNNNVVNIGDFGLLVNAYKSQPGDPYWDDHVDFNCDGLVDIGDFGLLVNNYGDAGDL